MGLPLRTVGDILISVGDSRKDSLEALNRKLNADGVASDKPLTPIGKLLISRGLITPDQLLKAIEHQKEAGEYLGQAIVELGFLSEQQLVAALSSQLDEISSIDEASADVEVDESKLVIDPAAINLVTGQMAVKANAVSIQVDLAKKTLVMGVIDTRDMTALDEIRFSSGCQIQVVEVSQNFLQEAWKTHYRWSGQVSVSKQNDLLQTDFRAFAAKLNDAQVGPFIHRLLSKASELKVSDIHIDPFKNDVQVRFRIDGKLYQAATFNRAVYPQFIGKLRVMANIDLSDKKHSIDTRMSVQTSENRHTEYRVSILNSLFGERVVLRVQRDSSQIPRLSNINVPKVYTEMIAEKLRLPHGMIIVTGPTGSGKTTTLYAMLTELTDLTRNIMTIEDPIELTLPGASQIPVEGDKGLGFSNILRSVLRQDPDVIMVGEIRDEETAQIAVRAAMTGHLVLASLHTNDALASITRLQDMGIAPYYLGPALNLLLAQRLIRLLCDDCKKPVKHPRELLLELGFSPEQIKGTKFFKARGCSKCNMTGYRGRMPIFEMLSVNQALQDSISRGDAASKMRAIAKKNKYVPFLTLLKEYLKRGKTSIDEAMPYLLDR
ncbi:MAG: hypothetical protein COV44_11120 [Deltaproteobacteria bacterium CG11_big_fil_rev_8_21_14_0_20_45_16]|nr:MAG: hypothetical protein COV44_11120 [Deltaproteobacteria bacterium CG11_big_fil_rev_8_21_14_0_20_45_16]